ncbi:unnamed protein product [Caretta caretta]
MGVAQGPTLTGQGPGLVLRDPPPHPHVQGRGVSGWGQAWCSETPTHPHGRGVSGWGRAWRSETLNLHFRGSIPFSHCTILHLELAISGEWRGGTRGGRMRCMDCSVYPPGSDT